MTVSVTDPDVVIHDALVMTVDGDNELLQRGTIVVSDGRLAAVRETEPGDGNAPADVVVDGSGTLVMPGLVNAHAHLELTPVIGGVSELGLLELWGHLWAVYSRIGAGDFSYLIEAGYELAALNFLTGGITTTNSMDMRPRPGAEAFGRAGLRAFFGAPLSDLFWDVPVDDQFARARDFVEEYHRSYDGRIRATICPHDDWSCTSELWERVADLAAEYPDLLVHTHLLELEASNTMARANGAADSLDLLEDVGLLDDRLVAAHFRLASDEDVRRTSRADASVVHCPSVFCHWNPNPDDQWTPVPSLRDAGVDVGLGLDDHYWHDSYDLFGEARQARLAANLERGTGQFTARELVRMLTIDGARALSVGDEIGSLEPGKRADLIVLDLTKPKFAPVNDAFAHVANQAGPADVQTVIVDGDVVMRDGEIETVDPEAVLERATSAIERFEDATGWTFDNHGTESPSPVDAVRDAPKRGPARLIARLATRSARETIGGYVRR
ncbi:amidohydrolase family protein [Halovivax limisalsi]|uniref:amidohydrolase family protein n=1 Tax=Halovivax limisalsi TaxID=1453760 RepID=UPI001FFCB93F|nr:amidohydrolase family protein [Halovivax limisalsi]